MARTTDERSATAKAAAARRQADKALGLPSIAALAAELHAAKPWRPKAEARREAVRRIEAGRTGTAHPATDRVSGDRKAVIAASLACMVDLDGHVLYRLAGRHLSDSLQATPDEVDAAAAALVASGRYGRTRGVGSELYRRA